MRAEFLRTIVNQPDAFERMVFKVRIIYERLSNEMGLIDGFEGTEHAFRSFVLTEQADVTELARSGRIESSLAEKIAGHNALPLLATIAQQPRPTALTYQAMCSFGSFLLTIDAAVAFLLKSDRERFRGDGAT
jgi:hypothetical protein